MGNRFSDFLNNNDGGFNSNLNSQNTDSVNFNNFDTSKVDTSNFDTKKAEDLINKYSTYSEDRLMQEFIKLSQEKIKDGTFNRDISNVYDAISPYLNEEQKKRMNDLINRIK